MNRLMRDAHAPDVASRIGAARANRFRRHPSQPLFKYVAPNGFQFDIDARPLDSGGPPVITSPAAKGYGASHATHTLGDGVCCVVKPDAVREMDLCTLLFHIDSWARGMELYKQGCKFPDSPKEAFGHQHEKRSTGLFGALFG